MAEGAPLKSSLLEVKAIVIDLDGTMIDSGQDILVALNRMLDGLRLPHVDEEFVLLMVGKGTEHLIAQTLEHVYQEAIANEKMQTYAIESYLHHYSDINGQYSKVYPGVSEGLEQLRRQGFSLACLTNKPSALAGPILIKKGLAHYFDCVFGGDAFIRKKPDALPLIRTCEALNATPKQAIMVGDSVNDSLTGRGAGTAVALMRYGYNHGNPIDEVDADYYLDSLAELPLLLKKI